MRGQSREGRRWWWQLPCEARESRQRQGGSAEVGQRAAAASQLRYVGRQRCSDRRGLLLGAVLPSGLPARLLTTRRLEWSGRAVRVATEPLAAQGEAAASSSPEAQRGAEPLPRRPRSPRSPRSPGWLSVQAPSSDQGGESATLRTAVLQFSTAMSGDPDIECLRHFYTAGSGKSACKEWKDDGGVDCWSDANWNSKLSKIVTNYRKKANKHVLRERIIQKEQRDGRLEEPGLEARRQQLIFEMDDKGARKEVQMKTLERLVLIDRILDKQRDDGDIEEAKVESRREQLHTLKTASAKKGKDTLSSIAESLGISAKVSVARNSEEEADILLKTRDLMYRDLTEKYKVDPRDEMKRALEEEAEAGKAERAALQSAAAELEARAAQKAATAARAEQEVADQRDAMKVVSVTEATAAQAAQRKAEEAAAETAKHDEADRKAKEAAEAAAQAHENELKKAAKAQAKPETEEAAPQATADKSHAACPTANTKKAVVDQQAKPDVAGTAPEVADAAVQLQTEQAALQSTEAETAAESEAAVEVPSDDVVPTPTAVRTKIGGIGTARSSQRNVDAELKDSKAREDKVYGQQARRWINAVRKDLKDPAQCQEAIEGDDLAKELQSGVILLELLNAIRPEKSAVKLGKGNTPIHHKERIGKFIKGCKELGVPEAECFDTNDLYDRRKLGQVWRCIASLSKHTPESYAGPTMQSEAAIRAEIKAADEAKARVLEEEAAAAAMKQAKREEEEAAAKRAEEKAAAAAAKKAQEEEAAAAAAKKAQEEEAAAVAAKEMQEEEATAAAAKEVEAKAAASDKAGEQNVAEAAAQSGAQVKPQQSTAAGTTPQPKARAQQTEAVVDKPQSEAAVAETDGLMNEDLPEGVPPPRRWWCCIASPPPSVPVSDSGEGDG